MLNALSRLTNESVSELEWETIPSVMEGGGRVACAATAVSKNEIVVAGGSNGYLSILSLTQLLNVETNQWTNLPSLNNPRFGCGAATIATTAAATPTTTTGTTTATTTTKSTLDAADALRRRVYVVGGTDGGMVMSSVEVLDLSVHDDKPEWSMLEKPMSCPRWGCAVVSCRDRLYVIGGHNGTAPLKSSEVYHESTGEWRSLPDMSVARSQCAAAVIDECIYVLGGTDAQNTHSSCEVYDMATNSWSSTALPDMNTARSGCCAAAIGNQLFCMGQANPDFSTYQEYLSYIMNDRKMLRRNKSTLQCGETINVAGDQQWLRLPPMATIRYQAAVVALDNHQLVIVGGESRSKRHDTIERLVLKSVPVYWDLPPLPPCAVPADQEEEDKDDNKKKTTSPETVLRGLELWLEQAHGLVESANGRTQQIQSHMTDRLERAALRHRQAVSEQQQELEQAILRHQQAIQNVEIEAQREGAEIDETSDAIRIALVSWKSNATGAIQQTQRRIEILCQQHNLTRKEPAASKKQQAPFHLVCPLSKQLMEDPVVAADGHTYEREEIQKWVDQEDKTTTTTKSPITGEPLAHTYLTPNLAIRKQCQQEKQQQQL